MWKQFSIPQFSELKIIKIKLYTFFITKSKITLSVLYQAPGEQVQITVMHDIIQTRLKVKLM